MAVNEIFLGDFSGGEVSLRSSLEPQENQWLLLEGLVLDRNKRLRSQWEGATWEVGAREFEGSFILDDEERGLLDGTDVLWETFIDNFNVEDFGIITGRILAVSEDEATSGWYISNIPNGLEQPEWIRLETPDADGKLRIVGQMAYQVVDDEAVFWVDALLCNSSTETDVNPFAVYIDPRTDQPAVKEWTNTFPSDERGTPDSMPHAGRCTMWGDFLVLGDIVWKADADEAFDEDNQLRYRHGLWFSIAGKTDTFDPIDTVFTGQKAGRNVVQGMFPLEKGLLVITCTLVSLLQGTPDDFIYRELREGISNCGRNGAAAWQNAGGVVWKDQNDYIWFTNGESFVRFDNSLDIEGANSVAASAEYLFVSAKSGNHVFRAFEDVGGWTRLVGTQAFSKMIATEGFLIALDAREDSGSFILDDEVYGLLDDEYTLWGPDKVVTVFDFNSENRGVFNGKNTTSTVRTRPLLGFGHRLTFWHRYGVRAVGSGRIRKAVSRPSSNANERGLEERIHGDLSRRGDYIFYAHGPSIEATFDVQFEGDVTVEHMNIWEHGGRLKR
jgi:hypothetical protein